MQKRSYKRDTVWERYSSDEAIKMAQRLLQADEQSEEAFLGAQGVLMLHNML